MEDFCKYLGINSMLSLIFCLFWIFSTAERNTISKVVGSKVILPCKNESNHTFVQLTWKMNEVVLFSFTPQAPLHISQEARRLNINMLQSQIYILVIERVQRFHTGNYTCEITTKQRAQEQTWELVVTEHNAASNKLLIAVATVVPCVCCLTFILALTILSRVCKKRAEDRSPTAEMEHEETIYENCLRSDDSQQRGKNQPHHHKPRTDRKQTM